MQSDYVAPELNKDAFNCPHCKAYTQMQWSDYLYHNEGTRQWRVLIAKCILCKRGSVWHAEDTIQLAPVLASQANIIAMIYPYLSTAPMPSPDLPEDCRTDYLEAREIVSRSPRGAAALLRLVLQKLCKHLGGKGKKIDDDIGWLVREKNLSVKIQKALDIVRVIGNDAVHPGELDLNDAPEIAITLFKLINLIVDEMITQPKSIDALFEVLPENKRNAIEKRDEKAPTS